MKKALVVINREAGYFLKNDGEALASAATECLKKRGIAVKTVSCTGATLDETLKSVATRETDLLAVAGGDGTIACAAQSCIEQNKRLAILPCGTMNMLARSLSIPLDPIQAASKLGDADEKSVDVALANDRVFIHQFSVGIQPRLVENRRKLGYSSRFEKMLNGLRAALTVFSVPPSFHAQVSHEGRTINGPFSMLAVSSNPHEEGHLPYPSGLQAGAMGIYWAHRISGPQAARIIADLIAGTWSRNELIHADKAKHIEIRFHNLKKSAKATLDGELLDLPERVDISIKPGALKVLC